MTNYEAALEYAGLKAWQVDGFYRREVVQISQSELAELTGVKQPVISAYESGRENRPSTHAAYAEIGVELWATEMLWGAGLSFLRSILSHEAVRHLNRLYPGAVPMREEWDNGEKKAAT